MYKENKDFIKLSTQMLSRIRTIGSEAFTINENFNVCLDTLAQAVVNPLKISYIKKDKIVKLIEYAGITITDKPTPEQREKYFNACTLEKFANHFFNKVDVSEEDLEEFNKVVAEAKEAANALLPKTFHIFDAKHIPQLYNYKYSNDNNNKPFDIGKVKGLFIPKEGNGINKDSCMQGKPKKYFEIYTDINQERQTLKMAVLTHDSEIVARALIWIDKPINKIDRRRKLSKNRVYIDRIYTKTQTNREITQAQLYEEVHKYFNIDKTTSCDGLLNYSSGYNWAQVQSILQDKNSKRISSDSAMGFNVHTNNDHYNYYPYMDTLRYLDTYNQVLTNDIEDGDKNDMLKLDSTCGEAEELQSSCEHCGYETHEDNLQWVETAESSCCEDCCTYCDEREEYILTDDAIYNNYSGSYHYANDLDM